MIKEVLWLTSNIAANSERDSIELLKHGLVSNLIYSAKDRNPDHKKEALWALSNVCHSL